MVRGFTAVPSDQPENTCRVSGPPCGVAAVTLQAAPALQMTLVGAVYVPAGHPEPAIVNWADTLLVIVTDAGAVEKFAVIVEGEFNKNEIGLSELTTFPLHPVNWYPAAGAAVSSIPVPAA
jgi:hypothetical protein